MKRGFFVILFLIGTLSVEAQSPENRLASQDYAHAAQFMSYNTARYVDHGQVTPNWRSDDQFWFRDLIPGGSRFIWVNPHKKVKRAAFDQQKLATALSEATGRSYTAEKLPFRSFSFAADQKSLLFYVDGQHWRCDLNTYKCTKTTGESSNSGPIIKSDEVLSPDGKKAAFIRNYNLWIRDLATGEETQLTTDGIKNFGYATDNASWRHSDRPILRWSPDSKKIATYKQDQRKVSNMYLVSTHVGAPRLEEWKYELPGDSVIMKIHRVIINIDTPQVVFLNIPADPRRSTMMDDIIYDGHLADVQWSSDGGKLAFVSTSRYHKTEKVRIADATTGKVREVFQEKVSTQFESGDGGINWRYLSRSNEFIWFSERDNLGHLYLYDARTGRLKNKITAGDYVVYKIVKVDEKDRIIYFMATGLQKENPYFKVFCKVRFDGKGFKELTPEPGDHRITLSPSGDYFIDRYSKPDVPGVAVLRNIKGKVLLTLARTDVSRLKARGWKPPHPFSVKAADGQTDIYGLLFTPTHLDKNKKYPIIDYIYPGPQAGSIGNWSFTPSRRDNQALAELGFVVVAINGTGNPLRTKDFQDRSYGNMAINTLPDQIAGIRQLAKRYPYIDTTRVGIWGHSGGGFATAAALFRYPDFFKVGIAESGNHDNRNYESDWGDRFNGPIHNKEYAAQANETYAKNLKGKLMLVVGLMDNNVPPQNTLLVVQALEDANKDFDLVIYPNSRHGYGEYYFYEMRRRWDYFVKNLLGKTPPKEYQFHFEPDPRNGIK